MTHRKQASLKNTEITNTDFKKEINPLIIERCP